MTRWTLRTRMAVVWSVGFFVLGAVLLVALGLLVQDRIAESPDHITDLIVGELGLEIDGLDELTVSDPAGHTVTGDGIRRILQAAATNTRADIGRSLWMVLPLLGLIGGFVGWWLAGRAVVPIAAITAQARRVSSDRLDTRIDLHGPDDELKELADAFDSMMERLEHSFEAQRRFAASASHELRTPLTVIRTELDVAFDTPNPDPDELAEMARGIRASIARSEKTINSLLILARSGIVETVTPIDLTRLVDHAIEDLSSDITTRNITVERHVFEPATTRGDPVLMERLVRNLLANAVAHNLHDGLIEVEVHEVKGGPVLRIANTGEPISPQELGRLSEPFYRGHGGHAPGSGLGLAIVASIAEAHSTRLELAARPGGGMVVTIKLPESRLELRH